MILKPVRAEEVTRRTGDKVRASYRIVDSTGDYVASVVSAWGRSDEARYERAMELVRLINSGR